MNNNTINNKTNNNIENAVAIKPFDDIYRKMENFRVVQFSRNFAVCRDPRKLKSAKYFSSLFKVKAIIYKRLKDTVLQ